MLTAEAKVGAALEACRHLLTAAEYREVFELNTHSEWGVAIVFLADFLGEKGAQVSDEQLRLIEGAFAAMKMEPGRRTEFLRELRTPGSP